MKSILFIAENFPPDKGGIAVSADRIVQMLSKFYNIHVITFSQTPYDSCNKITYLYSNNRKVYRLSPFLHGWKHKLDKFSRALILENTIKIIAKLDFWDEISLIHGFGMQNAGYIASKLKEIFNIPLIQSIRGNDVGRNIYDSSKRQLLKHTLRNSDVIVTVNEWLFKTLLNIYPEMMSKTIVIPNSIDLNDIHLNRTNQQNDNQNKLLIGYVGSLREKKGPHIINDLVNKFIIPNEGKLLIIGDIDLSLYKTIGWKNIKWKNKYIHQVRARDRNELFRLIEKCNWFIYPSLDDGMANGVLEIMCSGKICVASEIFSDVITDKKDGFIVYSYNSVSYLEKCNHIFKNRSILARMGNNARMKIFNNFIKKIELAKWKKEYNILLKTK